jgi:hypothetical protein
VAERAGVSHVAVANYRKKCVNAFTAKPPVKLEDLYADDIPYWTQRQVKAVEAALQGCSREQLAYLFSEVLPIFHRNLVRKQDDHSTQDGIAKED